MKMVRGTTLNARPDNLQASFLALAFWWWIAVVLLLPAVSWPAALDFPLTGKLLVAAPEMRDPRFVETVIYMVMHNSDGAMGIVINRPIAAGSIADLLKSMGLQRDNVKGEIVIHYGGPVRPEAGFLLHSDDVSLDSSMKVKDGIAITTDPKLIEAISRGKGPRQSLLAVGYAGWAPGQLEDELNANAWFAVSADRTFIFGKDAEKKWRGALDRRQVPL